MLNRINFSNYIEKYGNIVTTSNDGQVLVLRKNIDELIEKSKEIEDQKELLEELMTVHIVKISVFEITYIRKLNIFQYINN